MDSSTVQNVLGVMALTIDTPYQSALSFADWLGVAGFFLGVASLLWLVFIRWDDRREKVQGILRFEIGMGHPQPWLLFRVWNSGRIPVYISQVQLGLGNMAPPGVTSKILTSRFHCSTNADDPLMPGQDRNYSLPIGNMPSQLISAFLAAPDNEVWLAVQSSSRNLLVLKGDQVKAHLKLFATQSDQQKK